MVEPPARVLRVTCEAGRWYLALGVDWDRQRRYPIVWSAEMDAAGRAESRNARGQARQSPASAAGGGLGKAGSARARNPHAGPPLGRQAQVKLPISVASRGLVFAV